LVQPRQQQSPPPVQKEFSTPMRDWLSQARDKINATNSCECNCGKDCAEQLAALGQRVTQLEGSVTQLEGSVTQLGQAPGPAGQDGQDADPAAVVDLLIERIKTDEALRESLRGPPGPPGKDGRDGINGRDGVDGAQAPPATAGVTHAVLVVDRNASYWPRLSVQLERARQRFQPIRIAPPPTFATKLPVIVFYAGGDPIVWKEGEREVVRTLQALERGDISFLTES
jgi:hypothetical protein